MTTLNLSQPLAEKWQQQGFGDATAVQEATFDRIVNKQDLIAISPTGSGKTLAYALPTLETTEANLELQTLILIPSQELAHQVGAVFREWAQKLEGIRVQTIAGGANLNRQIEKLKEKPQIVIGTPGRVFELINRKKLKLHQLKRIIFDEADFLLKKEHQNEVREIVKRAPSDRQLLFFSATANRELTTVSRMYNSDPTWIDVSEQAKAYTENLKHGYILGMDRKRGEVLRQIGHIKGMRALVFVNSIEELLKLEDKLIYENIPVAALHSDSHSSERKLAVDALKSGQATYLLTTDVMARGMDIEDLPYVIQYDIPLTQAQYLHRSGRTGRMGKEGLVLSLVSDRNLRNLKQIHPASDELKEYYVYNNMLTQEKKR